MNPNTISQAYHSLAWFPLSANATNITQKQSDYKVCFDSKLVVVVVVIGLMETRLKEQLHDHDIKKQIDYVVEQSSFPLIALFWLKIGRCRGRH